MIEMKEIFFLKNVSEHPNPPDELAQNVSKKIFFGRIIPHFSSKVQNLTVFSIVYMIRIRFFRTENISEEVFDGAVTGAHEAVLDYTDLFNNTLHVDDIQDFDTRWDQVLLTTSDVHNDKIPDSLCQKRIPESTPNSTGCK